MGTLVDVTRKTETIQAYQLESADDMFAALKYVSAGNYSGSVNYSKEGDRWNLLLTNTVSGTSAYAFILDWIIIENSSIASVCKASDYTNLFNPPA